MNRKIEKLLYYAAFIDGAMVMAMEVCSTKMIAPAFGNSIYVWSIALAITMFSLACGYFVGGKFLKNGIALGDKLVKLLWLLTFLPLVIPFFASRIIYACLEMNFISGAFVSLFLLVFPFLLLAGIASPLIVELICITSNNRKIGRSAGNVWSVSTIGGIVAAFVFGIFLLPNFGIKNAFLGISFLPGIVVLLYHNHLREHKKTGIMALVLLLGVLLNLSPKNQPHNSRYKEIYKSDGLLGQLSIVDDKKYNARKLLINGISQSFMNIPTGRSQWKYVHRLAMYSSIKPEGSKALIAGMGAGNLANELLLLNFNVDVVDIDRRMEFVAKKYFGLKNGKINSFVDDARHYIKTTKEKYDIIIFDLSSGENQPSNLYTLEGFADTKKILKPEGILFVHSPGMLIHNQQGLQSIGNTMLHSGYKLKMLNTSPTPNTTGEFIFYATTSDLDLQNQDYSRQDSFSLPYKFPQKNDVYFNILDFTKGYIMTDDKPILEYLQQENIKGLRRGSNRETKEMINSKEKSVF